MASYVIKGGAPTRITSSANTDLLTVPASHRYLLKGLTAGLVAGSSTASTIKFQVSDAAGANFKDLTPAYSTGAVTGNTAFLSLAVASGNPTSSTLTSNTELSSSILNNLILEAGQILRAVTTGGSGQEENVAVSYVDYTV